MKQEAVDTGCSSKVEPHENTVRNATGDVVTIKTEPCNIDSSIFLDDSDDVEGNLVDDCPGPPVARGGAIHTDDEAASVVQLDQVSEVHFANSLPLATNHKSECLDSAKESQPYKRELGSKTSPGAGEADNESAAMQMLLNSSACATAFTGPPSLNAHGGQERHKCEQCPAEFTDPSNLKRDTQTHFGQKTYSRTKKTCSLSHSPTYSSFTDPPDLKDHMQTHSGPVRYKCEHCAEEYSRFSSLQAHTLTACRSGPYKCDLCPASFSRPAHVKCHSQVHVRKSPYECDFCPAELRFSSSLTSHLLWHSGERPYKCNLCSSTFPSSLQLKRHVQAHGRDRQYKCGWCDKAFTCLLHWKIHRQACHAQKQS